jgi:MFS transporter, YNFM family, putative membrane transport protein
MDDPSDSLRLQPGRRAQLRSTLLVFAVHGLEAAAYTVLLADLAGGLRLSDSRLGVALATLSATSAVGILAAGRLSDRLGRRTVQVASAASVDVFYAGLATLDSYRALLAVDLMPSLAATRRRIL